MVQHGIVALINVAKGIILDENLTCSPICTYVEFKIMYGMHEEVTLPKVSIHVS